jgi:hypothetical protein
MSEIPGPSGLEGKQEEEVVARRLDLENRLKAGANWFYWIAGLSVINSIVVLMRGDWSFIIGLGVTQVMDALALGVAEEEPDLRVIATVIALLFNLIVVTICAVFGLLANKKKAWAFWVGMALYAMDGLIFLLVQDYFSLGFHAFALWGIYGGLRALNEIRAAEMGQPRETESPGAISPE